MMVIGKFPLISMSDHFSVLMPAGASIVKFTVIDYPTIFALCNAENDMEVRRFQMVPSGFEIPDRGNYVGTAMMTIGSRTFQGTEQNSEMHFFELKDWSSQ
jgi:hypothetical protein